MSILFSIEQIEQGKICFNWKSYAYKHLDSSNIKLIDVFETHFCQFFDQRV